MFLRCTVFFIKASSSRKSGRKFNNSSHFCLSIKSVTSSPSDKMCADSSTGNTPNTPQCNRPICPNRPIIWDIFEKNSHHISFVHVIILSVCKTRSLGIAPKDSKTNCYTILSISISVRLWNFKDGGS